MGRAPDTEIVLFDKKCSRAHCLIYSKGTHFAVEDLESKHGTWVNGKRIQRRTSITFGDRIQIGRTTLVVSKKAVGGFMEKTATDAAADLKAGHFDRLMDRAAEDVVRTREGSRRKKGLWGSLKSGFGGQKGN